MSAKNPMREELLDTVCLLLSELDLFEGWIECLPDDDLRALEVILKRAKSDQYAEEIRDKKEEIRKKENELAELYRKTGRTP
jgi:hypothetical protein